MEETLQFGIFGDSLMKGTLPADGMRYAFHKDIMERLLQPIQSAVVVNKAKFGATIEKGLRVLQKDLNNGSRYDYALLEYGGNDCNYDWPAISENPEGAHDPAVSLPEFTRTLRSMIDALLASGAKPVLMTLPPIDAEKYLDRICQPGLDRDAILQWLGDANRIYRTQELYSDAIYKTAMELGLPCVDVRSIFLQQVDFPALISDDGIHPSEKGYELLYSTLIDSIPKIL